MDRLLRPGEVSEMTRMTEKTLANWRSSGEGPPHLKVGGRILYRESDVLTWLAGCYPTAAGD